MMFCFFTKKKVSSIEKKKAKILCLRIIFDIIRIGANTFRNTQIGKGIPSCNDYEPDRKRGVSRCLIILSHKNWSWLPLTEEFLHSFCVSAPNTSLRGRNYLKNFKSGFVKDTGEYPQSANLLLRPYYFQERQNQAGIGNHCVQMRFYQNYTSPIIIIMKPLNILGILYHFDINKISLFVFLFFSFFLIKKTL
ncbi:transmembrane protein, putative (macronuclear) [Tetrahymena thermophila SB210]|uniref:Transmembrane protein, putative n=1 Tax=Tetrahymena thermophila (strain SB210) TaxID=312017 RepID=Q23C61_TETTS|nr:transmembrane protein, putative [Tetrahymena thermophila SB210]EAR93907.2 transmembrane protein, putative [Tetrahymena thermophila SB210]|eukprot:XP_001014152.2 transmembrane protein, putative [Tetrahymena thermophila SB210]